MEIGRVFRPRASLLLTPPNDRFFLRFLDPVWWLFGHRHYKRERLLQLPRKGGPRTRPSVRCRRQNAVELEPPARMCMEMTRPLMAWVPTMLERS